MLHCETCSWEPLDKTTSEIIPHIFNEIWILTTCEIWLFGSGILGLNSQGYIVKTMTKAVKPVSTFEDPHATVNIPQEIHKSNIHLAIEHRVWSVDYLSLAPLSDKSHFTIKIIDTLQKYMYKFHTEKKCLVLGWNCVLYRLHDMKSLKKQEFDLLLT